MTFVEIDELLVDPGGRLLGQIYQDIQILGRVPGRMGGGGEEREGRAGGQREMNEGMKGGVRG